MVQVRLISEFVDTRKKETIMFYEIIVGVLCFLAPTGAPEMSSCSYLSRALNLFFSGSYLQTDIEQSLIELD